MTESACCPHCGYVLTDLWEYGMDDGECKTVECPKCDKEFRLTCHITVDYSAELTGEMP